MSDVQMGLDVLTNELIIKVAGREERLPYNASATEIHDALQRLGEPPCPQD